MNLFLAVLLGLFLLAYVMIGVVVARRPLIGRIATREAARRLGQTAVLVAGLMIAGAAIFSIQVIFDSMYETSRAQVLQNLGRDDVEISGGGYFDAGLAQRLAGGSQSCSCIAAFQNAIVTSGSVVDLDRLVGKPNVQITGLDLAAEGRFGSFVLAGGHPTSGDELAAGGVFLTQPLAAALGAQTGDHLRVIAGGTSSRDVTVAGIVRRVGAGAYGFDRSMFASLATAQLLTSKDGVNLIRISARGDGDAEVAGGRAAAPVLRALLATNGASLQVLEVKSGALEIVVKMSENGRPFVTSFGVIIALAATALVANLALMLSEERRPRLAVLRALGLTRTGLVQLSVTEGGIYSLLGAIAGLPAGLALAIVIISHGAFTPGGPQPVFSVHIESLLGAVAAAALINMLTVFLASLRTTGMAISAAIRDLPEPSITKRPSRKRLAFMAATALLGLIAMVLGHSGFELLGGALIIAATAGLIRGRVSDRVRYTAAGAAAAAWAIFDGPIAAAKDNTPGPFAFAFAVLVLALSVLIATNLSILDSAVGLVGHLSGGLRATLRPAMAYSSRRPVRSGLVIAAFAIVMTILVLAQSLVSAQTTSYRIYSGGWDVQAAVAGTDRLSVPAALQSEVARQVELHGRTFFGPVNWTYSNFMGTTGWHQEPITVFGVTQQQLETGMGFVGPNASAAAWDSIARNPNLVAYTEPVGSVVLLATDHGTISFRVAAEIPATNGGGNSSIVPGLIASQQSLDELATSAPSAVLLLNAAPGTSPVTLARDLQRATLASGADVSTTRALLDQDAAASGGLSDFLVLIMRIGLLIGVASLGAVALRAVIERRRSIGMLRAIGYQPAQVLAGMLAETAFVATAGLAVGMAVAFALGGTLVRDLSSGGQFTLDIGSLALTIAIVYAAVLLVTLLPALRAARLRPAEALRVLG